MSRRILQVVLVIAISTLISYCIDPSSDSNQEIECGEGYIRGKDDPANCYPDTVGHDFEWTVWRFGDIYGPNSDFYNSSIDKNGDIWVVGQIWRNDSTLELGYYDNTSWDLRDVKFEFSGNEVSDMLFDISIVNDSTIWLSGSFPIIGDGFEWELMDYREQGLPNIGLSTSYIWNDESSTVLFAGGSGRILRYQNGVFQFLESGIELRIRTFSESSGRYFASALENSGNLAGQSALIYSLDQTNWSSHKYSYTFDPPSTDEDPGIIKFVQAFGDTCIYATPQGVYKFEPVSGYDEIFADQYVAKTYHFPVVGVSGNTQNDFIILGDSREIVHFDGYNWRKTEINIAGETAYFVSVLFQGNTIILTGGDSSTREAIVVIGRRL